MLRTVTSNIVTELLCFVFMLVRVTILQIPIMFANWQIRVDAGIFPMYFFWSQRWGSHQLLIGMYISIFIYISKYIRYISFIEIYGFLYRKYFLKRQIKAKIWNLTMLMLQFFYKLIQSLHLPNNNWRKLFWKNT